MPERSVALSRIRWSELLGTPPPPSWPREISGVHPDSRRIRGGHVFVAVEGRAGDGRAFVEDAIRRGAAAVVSDRPVDTRGRAPVVRVDNAREALSRIALEFYGHPDRELRITGVTGTNGKTSVTGFIHQLLTACGRQSGLLGTVAYTFGYRNIPARHTTPGAPDLQGFLRQMVDAGCTDCAMEISSHALDQRRVAGLRIDTAVFTNLSQDHLDYHRDMEAYFACKAELFGMPPVKRRVVGEDGWSARLAETHGPSVIRCGLGAECQVRAVDVNTDLSGTSARLSSPWGDGDLWIPLVGEHNLRNALQALAVVAGFGFPLESLLGHLRRLVPAPGRLQPIPSARGTVLVDYAHTPDALENVLRTLRPLTSGRLITVFGCGGDRDRGKRPLMAKAAAAWSNELILTTDNPRNEDPDRIFDDMRGGLTEQDSRRVVPDRKEAIGEGIALLEEGDVLLIAGKGHETVQLVGAMQIPFDDREVAAKLLAERNARMAGGV